MDLTDLYSPEELDEKRESFLSRVLGFYKEISDTTECAEIISHKLHGTGGNLGLKSLSEKGAGLQRYLHENGELNRVREKLDALKVEIEQHLKKIKGDSTNES